MARPRTTGPNIQFRLPLELHERLERRAAANGQTVHARAQDIVAAAMELIERPQPGTVTLDLDLPCEHPTPHDVLPNGGLHKCRTCGATQGKDKTWRQP